jgi:hypothetical protein
MLLTVVLTYRVCPVLRVDFLLQFSHIFWREKIKVLVGMNIFLIYCMRKLICRTDLPYDPPIFVA